MSASEPARTISPQEREAIRVLKTIVGQESARVNWRLPGSDGGNYDADLVLANGVTVAVEVTSSDGGRRNLASTHRRHYKKPATKNAWTIEIKPLSVHGEDMLNSQEVKQIVEEIVPTLRKIEREYQTGIDPRLYDPNLYNSLLQREIKRNAHLKLRVRESRHPDTERPPGITVEILPIAALQFDNTDILAKRTQEVIDCKSDKDQGAKWLVFLLCDYGAGAEQLRELCKTDRDPPNGVERLCEIDLKSFDKVVAYAGDGGNYAVLVLDACASPNYGLWEVE
ncbi:hypothetical protein [Candidatus Poriferisocius sp.]|uniref:hypothetical protein n=1 Tax=Candidatus Poriferisocius sp. TaxID=3101276 RepID=UPI003B016C54